MDEEDLAEAAEAQRVQTADGFAGLGSTEGDISRRGAFIDLFRTEGETIGLRLLKRMGWREGQGVGPKVRRKARLDGAQKPNNDADEETHLFAPENTHMISFVRKNDHKGLGYDGETRLNQGKDLDVSKLENDEEPFGTVASTMGRKNKMLSRGGIGIGILNDTGSDDDDPYEIGPRISYNKVVGGEKKKKKKPIVNGSIRPVFVSKKAAIAKASIGFRKCHDGRLPLDGFVLSSDPSSSTIITPDGKYLPPKMPEGWKSAKQPTSNPISSSYISTSEAVKVSKLNPKSRAALLGEAPLPGKSVFDFLSPAARDRLASASGKTDLPPALAELPKGYVGTDEQRRRELINQIPKLDKDVAIAALSRSSSGWMPYAEDEDKRARYRTFLESQAGIWDNLPERAPNIAKDDWLKELQEFAHCAQIFKPISGMMATRFTSSTTELASDSSTLTSSESLLSKPASKAEDPAEAAAKIGMFGHMTRSTQDFYPTRLLCKRFNVKPPAHVQLNSEQTADDGEGASGGGFQTSDGRSGRSVDLVSKSAIDDMLRESGGRNQYWTSTGGTTSGEMQPPHLEVVIDVERNEALEGHRSGEAVFKAIFGDSDDDND
jgi:G patch domain-containing protein 1